MTKWIPPPGTSTRVRDQWTKDPTWYAQTPGAFQGAQGSELNYQGLLDVANAHYKWLVGEEDAITPKGWCLVAAMWDPATRTIYASSIPRGPRKVMMAKESDKAPLWFAQASPLLAPYFAARDTPGMVADLSKLKLHAEDAVYYNWETTQGSRAQNGLYPPGSIIAVYGKGPDDSQEGRQYPLCSTVNNRDPTCRAVAIALGVAYQPPQAAPQQPLPNDSDDAFDDNITQDDIDALYEACDIAGAKSRRLIRGQGPAKRAANTTQCAEITLPSDDPASLVSLSLPSSDFGTSGAAPTVSCTYNNATTEGPASSVCVSGTSTKGVLPTSVASPNIITQSSNFTTWPAGQPTVTTPPKTIKTNFRGCRVCTVSGLNEDDCSPLPTSLGCTPVTPSTLLSVTTATGLLSA